MAIINPYLDPNAHGKLNNSLCFRRFKDQVVLQGLPVPKKISTVKQIAQREKMIQARNAFKLLPGETREYLDRRSIHERITPSNIFSRAFMLDQLPSEVPVIPMKKIIDLTLFEPVGVIPEHIKIEILDLGSSFSCKLWSKLNEKIGSEVPSEIGPNGAVTGDLQFSPVKFENGVCYKIPTGGYNQDFIDYGLLPIKNEAILEAWVKLMFPVVNGQPKPIGNFVPFSPSVGQDDHTVNLSFDDGHGLSMKYNPGGALHNIIDNTTDFDAASVHHLLIGWSRSKALPDNKSMVIYVDKIRTASTDEDLADNDTGIYLQLLRRVSRDMEGYIDNFKFYPGVEYFNEIMNNWNKENFPAEKNYGHIFDNKNQYVFENEVLFQGLQMIKVTCVHTEPVRIPYRYPITVKWEDNNFMEHTSIIRLPQLDLEPEMEVSLYLSADFSAYWDPILWRLAGTNIM